MKRAYAEVPDGRDLCIDYSRFIKKQKQKNI